MSSIPKNSAIKQSVGDAKNGARAKSTARFTLLMLISAFFGVGCSGMTAKGPEFADSWPNHDRRVHLKESQVVDLGLRLLALELNQRRDSPGQCYLEFLPQLGRIEARFILKERGVLNAARTAATEMEEREALREIFEGEINVINAGVVDLLQGFALGEGFRRERHLEVHFQWGDSLNTPAKEIAVYSGGKLNWLEPLS